MATRTLVAGNQFAQLPEPSDRLVDIAEAPGIDAEPAKIFHRVTEKGELPVEDGAHALRTHDQVAVAKIAMHEGHGLRPEQRLFLQPTKGEFEDGTRATVSFVSEVKLLDRGLRGDLAQGLKPGSGHRVDACKNFAEFESEPWPDFGVERISQNLARYGLAVHVIHQKAVAEFVLGAQEVQHARRRHATFARKLDEAR